VKDLAIHGGEVMRILGVRPSRIVGDVLEKLLERVIDDPSLNDKEKLSALVPEIAKEIANEPKQT
jgi:tRNA nucleotidyltransferase (CCA-adding enzyme)